MWTGATSPCAIIRRTVGTLIFQICTKREVPIYLGSSFAFIAPVIYSVQTWGMPATLGALAYSIEADHEFEDYSEPVVLARFGQTPED